MNLHRWAMVVAFLGAACGGSGGDGASGDDAAQAAAVAPRGRHLFVVQSKGFIAHIGDDGIGDLGSASSNAALRALAAATNAAFSEDPQDGDPSGGQYRLWAQVYLDVGCVGRAVSMQLTDATSDAGYEGPLKAEFDPIVTQFTKEGRFYYQARGRPAATAEPAFQLVRARTTSTIWYEIEGRVTCDERADATLHLDDVSTTPFPSFRLWVTEMSNGRDGAEALVVDRKQGSFSALWSLPFPPYPPSY